VPSSHKYVIPLKSSDKIFFYIFLITTLVHRAHSYSDSMARSPF